MSKKWMWSLAVLGVVSIIVLAVYSVQNYNEQLQAGSDGIETQEVDAGNGSNTVKETNQNESNESTESNEDESSTNEKEKEQPVNEESEERLAPEFTLQDLEGNDVSISDFRGKKVFLSFWATWCPYCKKQMPIMQELEEEGREDLVILTVATANSMMLEKHMKDNGFTFKVVVDHDKAVEMIQYKYKAMTIPGNFLIDEEGYIVAQRNSFSTREVMDDFLGKFDES